jgi:hypothetical protein
MIDLNDLRKPLVALLSLAAAATAGFVAGYLVGRDPETARRVAKSIAGGVTRTRVALAEARESLADLWAEARNDAQREIEEERFAAEAPVRVDARVAPKAEPAVAAKAALASSKRAKGRRTAGRRRSTKAKQPPAVRRAAKSRSAAQVATAG